MKLAIFDLDGTLCNTLKDIADSLNRALTQAQFPTFSYEQVNSMVGKSISYMCQRAMPKGHENDWGKVKTLYYKDYSLHLADSTLPYDGIVETLYALRDRGYTIACVTNKPHAHAVAMLTKLFPHNGEIFAQIQGQSNKFALKPDPETLLFVIQNLGAQLDDCVYVGDSEVDVQFAKNTGLPMIGCAWGFRGKDALVKAGASCIAETPKDLLNIL
ncbi:MAG TPA: HAD-IIIA family hydrolase [Eubacteriales bacterium]|nr:HAD-IIIA family hydrolase [Clostridia bacterium]HRV73790.1 HAD-IIIA family hydrolase [Eubacteriales bacterium]